MMLVACNESIDFAYICKLLEMEAELLNIALSNEYLDKRITKSKEVISKIRKMEPSLQLETVVMVLVEDRKK